MNYLRPTDQRKKDDFDLVLKVLRTTNGSVYLDYFNPFEIGTLRNARFERYYVREQKGWIDAEKEFESLAEVYGEFRPDKLGLIPEIPDFQSLTIEGKQKAIKKAIS